MANREADKFMLRLPEGMRGVLKEKAAKERRSMNSEIILALEAWMNAGKDESQTAQKKAAEDFDPLSDLQ